MIAVNYSGMLLICKSVLSLKTALFVSAEQRIVGVT